MRRPFRLHPLTALTIVGLAGCLGTIGDVDDEGAAGQALACSEVTPKSALGESPMHRLTRTEYRNTVRDLLDVDVALDAIPPDGTTGIFEGNATNGLTEGDVTSYFDVAMSAAEEAVADLNRLVPCAEDSPDAECAASFIRELGARAYRRPLTDEEVERLMVPYQTGAEEADFANGIRLALAAMLQSPHLLYRVELGTSPGDDVVELTPYELASRLSYALWKTAPDAKLLAAAKSGELATAEGLEAQAKRLLDDDRAMASIRDFHRQWLGIDELSSIDKDTEQFPDFNPSVASAMQQEAYRFIEHVYREDDATLSTLLTAPYSMLNDELAPIYGVDVPDDGEFHKVTFDDGRRAGLVTMSGLLALRADFQLASPTRRGVWVRETLFCQSTPDADEEIDTTLPDFTETNTLREWLEENHLADPTCAGCHRLSDPIGFGFDHYDAVGTWRDKENGYPIDDSGEVFRAPDDELEGAFDGAVDLANRMAKSPGVERCVSNQWARFLLGRHETNEEAECAFDPIYQQFAESGGDLRELLLALVTHESFRFRRLPTTQEEN